MGALFVYILKSSCSLALFYLFYRLLLGKETFFRFNRFALLGIFVISSILPFIEFRASEQVEDLGQSIAMTNELSFDAATVQESASSPFTWVQVLLLIYIICVLFFTLRYIYSVTRLALLLKKGREVPIENYLPNSLGIKLIVLDKDTIPFSWMNYIVISEKDLQDNSRAILLHECTHIRLHHSYDLIIAEVCIILQWFNPAAWLLKQELQAVHEYEADNHVLESGIDAKNYQLLLIKKAVGKRLYSIANNLNHSNLKKRITMMMRKKSNPWARLKYLYVLPVAAIAVAAFARPEVQETSRSISTFKVNDLVGNMLTNADENQFSTANPESLPEFPGGKAALMKFMAQSMRYPVEAIEQNIQGSVWLSITIDEDGNVTYPTVINSNANALMGKEAIRVARSMPKWQPAMQNGKAIKYSCVFPITFKLVDAKGEEITGISDNSQSKAVTLPANAIQMDELWVVGYGSK
ncbi:MAG: M56 family metallopeptidase [Bacteroidaceae bacterium]|nr:M56 family metallopeptidase [Bacteroidaceae bacterium]